MRAFYATMYESGGLVGVSIRVHLKNISKNFNTEDGTFVRSKTGSFHSRQA